MIGRQIGPYRVTARLGVGGMGEVYRAHDARLDRDVAIKILPAAFTSDPDRVARFEREARLLAALNHPNIGAIYGVEESEGTSALVLELVDGETLAERLRRGALPLAEVLAIARQTADALEAAHEKGIVHRDFKPANIKITAAGTVKVLDFGLAKAAVHDDRDLTQSPTVTAGGTGDRTVLGTPAYMSPEQARGQPTDKRTDIWAFGCVLVEMLTGRQAFAGNTTADTIAAILDRDPDWSALPVTTPPIIRRLVRRCLTKDPRSRLRDVADARLEIDEALGPSPDADLAAPGRSRRTSLRPLPWFLLAASVLLVLAGIAWWRQRPQTEAAVENPLASASFQRLTSFQDAELDAAISADGRFVVFISNRDGPYDAWVTQVGTGAFTNLTKGAIPYILNDELRNVGFTVDSEVVLLNQTRDATGRVVRNETYVLPLTGGPLRRLLDRGLEAAWSSDGSRLAYHEAGPGDPIFVADRAGREARKIFTANPGVHSHYLTWSPDDRFIYFVHGVPPDEMDIWRVPSNGGRAERVTFHSADVSYLAFTDQRTLLYCAKPDDGSGPWLYGIDVERPRPYRASLGVEHYLSIAASAGGRRLAATVSNPTSGLWTVPITDRVADEQSVTPVPIPNVRVLAPRYGPQSIWYLSSDAGINGLWCLKDRTTQEVWRPADGGLALAPALSADGQRLAFLVRHQVRQRLYVMNADGTDVTTFPESLDVRDAPTWSPDGKWIAAATGERLLKIPVDGGQPVTLVEGPARLPIWAPDGQLILYSESIQGGPGYPVKAVTPAGQRIPLPEFSVRRSGDRYRVMPDGRHVVFMVGDYGRQDFWLIDITTGLRRQLTKLRPGFSIQGFDISPDGTRILFDRVRENSDLVLIDLPPRKRH